MRTRCFLCNSVLLLSMASCGGGGTSGAVSGNVTATVVEPPAVAAVNSTVVAPNSPLVMELAERAASQYEADRLAVTPTADFVATGLYAAPGAQLTVQVDGVMDPKHGAPRLLVGTFSRYAGQGDPQEFPLSTGSNKLTVGRYGGLVYLRHTAPVPPFGLNKLKFSFLSGFVRAPHYVLGQSTPADWQAQLSAYTSAPDVVMQSKRSIMVFSRQNALRWKDNDQDYVLRTADRILDAEDNISGLDDSSEKHRRNTNQFLMTQATDGWMYATNFRAAFSAGAAQFAFTPLIDGTAGDAWGVWHELGHLHQQTWSWDALGEVTVNIYSMAAERALKVVPNRLQQDTTWSRAVQPYLRLPAAQKNFNADAVDVWVRLYMFHQLWLAYGDSFFQQLHRHTREELPDLPTEAAQMRYFMLQACKISGQDLTGFFQNWGLRPQAGVWTEIKALQLPVPATDLSALHD